MQRVPETIAINLKYVDEVDGIFVYSLGSLDKMIGFTLDQLSALLVDEAMVVSDEQINSCVSAISKLVHHRIMLMIKPDQGATGGWLRAPQGPYEADLPPIAPLAAEPPSAPPSPIVAPRNSVNEPLFAEPPQAPGEPPLSSEIAMDAAWSEQDKALELMGIGLPNTGKDMPFRVNNDAGRDGNDLTEDQIKILVSAFTDENPRISAEVVHKLTCMPMKKLMQARHLIPLEIRTQVTTAILSKDGLRSSFVPAELGKFLDENDNDITRLMGKKHIRSDKGEVPVGYDDSSFAKSLSSSLMNRYIDKSTTGSF